MAIPIEGYSVVAQKTRIHHLLESGAIVPPNGTVLADDELWCCCFMAESDAVTFLQSLEKLGLNVSCGPDSDLVLVHELDRSIEPYCEWLLTAPWEKAVIAWKAGTEPKTIVAREGWDPKVGSGLSFFDRSSMEHLEFVRLEGKVEVYRDKNTGKEFFIGRTSPPLEAMFTTATQIISKHFVPVGGPPVRGKDAEEVRQAIAQLEEVIAHCPDSWKALLCHGKAQSVVGNPELAYRSFRRAYELEKNVEAIVRELAGVCLELGRFEEAVSVAEHGVTLKPDDAALIGNLGVAYLLAGRLKEADKSIAAAIRLAPCDVINLRLGQIIAEVVAGKRPLPTTLASLSAPSKPKRRFWEFWKK